MKERIKKIRNNLKMSRTTFGEKIGVSGDVINNLERGRAEIKEPIIKLICNEFHASEEWLRTGQGEMFKEDLIKNEVGYYIEELLEDYKDNPFYDMVINMVKTYAELDEKSKKVIRNCSKKFQDNIKAQEVISSHASQDT